MVWYKGLMSLCPMRFDDMIDGDNPVRAIDAIVSLRIKPVESIDSTGFL